MSVSTAALDTEGRTDVPSVARDSSAAPCCGNCGSTYLRRARREPWQRIAFAFSPLRPYECWHCGWSAWLQGADGTPLSSFAHAAAAAAASLPRPGFDASLWVFSGVFILGAIFLDL